MSQVIDTKDIQRLNSEKVVTLLQTSFQKDANSSGVIRTWNQDVQNIQKKATFGIKLKGRVQSCLSCSKIV